MKRRSLREIFNSRAVKKAHRTTLALAGAAIVASCTTLQSDSHLAFADQRPAVLAPCPPDTAPPKPKLAYAEELFRQNDSAPPSEAVLRMSPEERMQYYMKKFCFEAHTAANDNDPRDQAVVAALNTLSNVTFMGKPLVDLADQEHLRLCALRHMPAGTAAQYLASDTFVAAGQNAKKQGQVLDLAHEITHAAQDKQGLLRYGYVWDIESRVRRNLSTEAAPVALEFAVAYEKKLSGDDSYWEYLKKHDANTAYTSADNHKLFEDTYNAGVAQGASQNDALRAGARAIFERVFDSDDWRNFYLTSELNSYIEDIANGKFRLFTEIHRGVFDQDEVDKAGKIGSLPSFTEGARLPAYAALFRGSQKMQWAYEAADIERHRQALGADHATVRAMEKRAADNKNPYTGIDFAEVNRRLGDVRWSSRFQSTWQVMDEVIKDRANPKPAPAPAAPCLPAPKPPSA
ncbi:MAG: hypothetical protein EPN97_05405 [Alphaproteobacteria bacterium]|nr:MAG: hypothetical protein EPN97_05405 [Alphaproteobacteria bacterium]